MAQPSIIVACDCEGASRSWKPTTLDQLNKSEEFLEAILAGSPELLGLETRRGGIHGPYRVFRQLELATPSGGAIYPDLTMLTASGHVIVVEVKRYVNAELRQRAVIAQIVDYASSFSALNELRLASLFGANGESTTWGEFVERLFPEDGDADDLATVLFNRIRKGELNIVIACDKVPAGLPDIVSGVAAQQATAFDLDLVEITPFVREVSDAAEIMFVPSCRLATKIVARTAVAVTYRQGDEQPSVSVRTTPIEEIEEELTELATSRRWTPEEVEEAFAAWGNPVALELLEFAKEHSAEGQFVATSPEKNAAFVFYVRYLGPDGANRKQIIVNWVNTWGAMTLYIDGVQAVAPDLVEDFRARLQAIFGGNVDANMKEPMIPVGILAQKLPHFKELILWLKANVSGA